MAKDNLFLGFGRGSVGDVVFSRVNGQQVARARNRAPRNPQSPLQLLQRVVMKTSASAYSLMQDICNHSFQGFAEGTECQSQFIRRNVEKFRTLLADYIESGDPEEILGCQETNFAPKYAKSAVLNPYIISEGSLAPVSVQFSGTNPQGFIDVVLPYDMPNLPAEPDDATYQDLLDGLGLMRGDQLTYCQLCVDDTNDAVDDYGYINAFHFGRFIIEPANGDLTSKLTENGNDVNSPNPRNENFQVAMIAKVSGTPVLRLNLANGGSKAPGNVDTIGAAGVIVSRLVGGVWQRSPCTLTMRSDLITAPAHFDGLSRFFPLILQFTAISPLFRLLSTSIRQRRKKNGVRWRRSFPFHGVVRELCRLRGLLHFRTSLRLEILPGLES